MTTPTDGEASQAGELRLAITAQSDYFGPQDDRGKEEAFELQNALQVELRENVATRPAPGEKGIISDVIVPLASSGALGAVVEVFKAWLSIRPKHRTITVDFKVDAPTRGTRSGTVTINATNVSDKALETAVREALQLQE
jgi:hypothetical protein